MSGRALRRRPRIKRRRGSVAAAGSILSVGSIPECGGPIAVARYHGLDLNDASVDGEVRWERQEH